MHDEGRYINDNEFRILGMSRSGNHAIVNWLMSQMPGRVCFLNCAEGKTNPFVTARPMVNQWRYEANYPEFDLEAEQQGRFTHKDYLLYSHEDAYFGRSCSRLFERRHDEWVGPSRRRFDVLILRDPFNLFASRRRSNQGGVTSNIAARIWKQHAREWLGETHRLRHHPVRICYNQWFCDRDYRREIAEQLDLPFSDQGLQRVAPCSGGSSFDGLSYDGQAQRMKVLERWRIYEEDDEFLSLFDQELLDLSERIFGVLPAAEIVMRRASRTLAGEA